MIETLVAVEALGPAGAYSSQKRETITDVTGAVVGEMTVAPIPYVNRVMSRLRKAPQLSLAARSAALAEAAEIFRSGVIGGLGRADYEELVARTSGVPLTTVQFSTDNTADTALTAFERAQLGRPVGAVEDFEKADAAGSGIWVRRGSLFGVLAAGNHPATHSQWLEAIALGYNIAVRPSRREPFTPYRLITALQQAGLSDHVALLPSDHGAADEIIRCADLALVYGGDAVMAKYAADPTVLPMGPGRSKILVTSDVDWTDYIDLIAHSVSEGGGTGCVTTTGILVEGDAHALAIAIAARLAQLPSVPPESPEARLPVVKADDARRIAEFVERAAVGAIPILGSNDIVSVLEDGSAVLRPSVHVVPAGSRALQTELAFPCVWVAPWSRQDGTEALGETLSLTVLGGSDDFIDELLHDPRIHNVYSGPVTTSWFRPGTPHDDYLGAFLMRSKAVVRR